MRIRLLVAGLLLAAASIACQFSAASPTATPPPTLQLPSPTFIIPASSTPAVTATPVPPTPTPRVSGGTVCYPRMDWQVYIVQPGDTLNLIGQRVGTTVTALALANCLTNANLIQAGQVLRVPMLPPPPVTTLPPIPTTATPQIIIVTATPTATVIPPMTQSQ